VYHTPEQGNNYFEELQTPTLLITADPPVPEFQTETTQLRMDILQKKGLVVHHPLPGSHHLHADPDTAPIVADKVFEFLSNIHRMNTAVDKTI